MLFMKELGAACCVYRHGEKVVDLWGGIRKPGPLAPFGRPSSFGHPGAGGSFGYADPHAEIGYAYVTNRMGTTLPFDPRDLALRTAISSVVD
jgi:CubicO group peptidase (beta-lactamase class C family)